MIVLFIAFEIYRGATERSKERASEIKESAYELVGREVAYKREGVEYTGTVYSVHYELDDEAYRILLFVYVTELDLYIIIDYGRYYDKVGFWKSVIPCLLSLALGYVVLGCFKDVIMVFVGSLLMMTGYLAGMAVFGAMIRDYTPEGKAGSFQGLRIVGQVLIPGIIGPAIGAAVLANADFIIGSDGTKSFVPNQNIFWAALVSLVLAAAVAYLVKYFKDKRDVKA
jgi:hypothetical protein